MKSVVVYALSLMIYGCMIVSGCNSNEIKGPNGRCWKKSLFTGNSILCLQKGGGQEVGGCNGKCPLRAGHQNGYDCMNEERSDPVGLGTCQQNVYQNGWAACNPNYKFNIQYKGGEVMTSNIKIYPIWLGTWTVTDKNLVKHFIRNVGSSSWYAPIRKYYKRIGSKKTYITGDITLGNEFSIPLNLLPNYKNLKQILGDFKDIPPFIVQLLQGGKLPIDNNGIYIIMLGADMTYEEFCTVTCGMRSGFRVGGMSYKFTLIGNPAKTPTGATCQTCGRSLFTTDEKLRAPNEWKIDSIIRTLAHELVEAITDPEMNAWQVYEKDLNEVADLCNNDFRPVGFFLGSRKFYNQEMGGKYFLLDNIWDHTIGDCDRTRGQHDNLRRLLHTKKDLQNTTNFL